MPPYIHVYIIGPAKGTQKKGKTTPNAPLDQNEKQIRGEGFLKSKQKKKHTKKHVSGLVYPLYGAGSCFARVPLHDAVSPQTNKPLHKYYTALYYTYLLSLWWVPQRVSIPLQASMIACTFPHPLPCILHLLQCHALCKGDDPYFNWRAPGGSVRVSRLGNRPAIIQAVLDGWGICYSVAGRLDPLLEN